MEEGKRRRRRRTTKKVRGTRSQGQLSREIKEKVAARSTCKYTSIST